MPKWSTVPELGFRGPWVKARANEYGKEHKTRNQWEFGEFGVFLEMVAG